MDLLDLLRALVAAYLVATLSATALAKLKNWRVTSVGILREGVIPSWAATAVAISVAAVELLIATVIMMGVEPVPTAITASILFFAFGGYQVLVAAKTNRLMCSCAGKARSDPASGPAVAGTIFACLVQVALAAILALAGGGPSGTLHLVTVTVWAVTVLMFIVGFMRQSGNIEVDPRFPVEFASHRYDFTEITQQTRG